MPVTEIFILSLVVATDRRSVFNQTYLTKESAERAGLEVLRLHGYKTDGTYRHVLATSSSVRSHTLGTKDSGWAHVFVTECPLDFIL